MPTDSELRNGLDATNYRSAEFIVFCYATLENVTTDGHTRYIGRMQIDAWQMGRPARRSRVLGRCESAAMMLTHHANIRKEIIEMFTLEDKAAEVESMCYHVDILDPVSCNETSERNRISIAVVIKNGTVFIMEPSNSGGWIRTLLGVIADATQYATSCSCINMVTVALSGEPRLCELYSPNAIMWCVWFCAVVHELSNEQCLLGVFQRDVLRDELDRFYNSFIRHIVAMLVLLLATSLPQEHQSLEAPSVEEE
jgi:hypothetical protein